MRESGEIALSMEKEQISLAMEINTQDNTKKVSLRELERTPG